MSFNIEKDINEVSKRLPTLEYALGKGLLQPFKNTNSSSRCIMQGVQKEQTMQCVYSEFPIISTGYENRFGELSSSFIKSDANYVVIGKVPKYPNDLSKMRKYTLVLLDIEHNHLKTVERSGYTHISESYGYTYDNTYMDAVNKNDIAREGDVIIKSSSFDENNNRCDGINLSVIYVANGLTTEDPILVSESAAKKLASPLFNKVSVMVNDNDIMLNLYGDDSSNSYKVFPDIGEYTKNGILCSVRRERKDEEALFAQSWENLKNIMISDEQYPVEGTVVDVDVYCNDPTSLENSIYNQQIYKYYQAKKVYCKKLLDLMNGCLSKGAKMDYETSKQYEYCKDILNDVQYIKDKLFNNIILEITLMKVIPLRKGDKITDRYGGKGVVSCIIKDEDMPHKMNNNGQWEPVDMQYNSSTCINRENPGQLLETSITFIGEKVIEHIFDTDESMEMAKEDIYDFLFIVNPMEAEAFLRKYNNIVDYDEKIFFIQSILNDGNIYCVIKPASSKFCLDKLTKLYERFPFVKQCPIMTTIKDSNGNSRNVIARRPLTVGYKYIYRLKQFAEEKFSAVSLAATNIKGENSKSKSSKQHKTLYSSTPVRFGEMEWEDLIHIQAVEQVIQVLMLLSSSPGARKLNQQLLTGDPFNIDIKLDADSTSRAVEIVLAYLKTIGLKLIIEKIPKKKAGPQRVVVTRIPGKNLKTTALERVPNFDDINQGVTDVMNAMIKSNNYPMPVVARVAKGTSSEDANNIIYDMMRSKAVHVANLYKEYYGIEDSNEIVKKILHDKAPVKEKPIRVVGRVAVKRLPIPEQPKDQ